VLHRAAYAALGLDGWSYAAIECDQAGLPGLIAGCGPDWAGLSLTMPLKETVVPLLDHADPLVTRLEAANTVVFGPGGLSGFNTDVTGIVTALAEAGLTEAGPAGTGLAEATLDTDRELAEGTSLAAELRQAAPVIIGAGGTARAALAALAGLGAAQVTLAVREPARSGPAREVAGRLGLGVTVAALRDWRPAAGQLVISTVPAGAADGLAGRLADRPPGAVLDVVYHPWPTRLAQAAERAGSPVIGGFDMLLHQAARQLELMTGCPAPVEVMRQAGLAELSRRGRNTSGGQNALLLGDDKSGR
jgi:shikimate dehydrogenase